MRPGRGRRRELVGWVCKLGLLALALVLVLISLLDMRGWI